MPRRKTVKDEIIEERAKAAKSPRKRTTAIIGESLADLQASGALTTGDHLPRQLEPATLDDLPPATRAILAAREAKSQIEPDGPQREPQAELPPSDREVVPPRPSGPRKPWTERVDQAVFAPIPDEYFKAWSDRQAGIRVSKKTVFDGGVKKSVAAIQFSESHVPNRAEKDGLEAAGFGYKPETRMWERKGQAGTPLGDNVIDAIRVAEGVAAGRNEGRER